MVQMGLVIGLLLLAFVLGLDVGVRFGERLHREDYELGVRDGARGVFEDYGL